MIKGDKQYGAPFEQYTATKAQIEALTGVGEGALAYAMDTDELGKYSGAAWVWTWTPGSHTHDHTALTSIGTNTHAQIDSHIASTANPHNVTAAQAGASALGHTHTAGEISGLAVREILQDSTGAILTDSDGINILYVEVA